jgi:tight adherence protein B
MVVPSSALLAVAEQATTQQSASSRLLVILAVAGIFGVVFLLVLLLAGNQNVERDLESRLSAYTGGRVETGILARIRLLRRFAVRAERLAERRGVLGQIETALEQANVHVRPAEAIAGALLVALLAGLLGLVLSGNPLVAIIFAAGALVAVSVAVSAVASRQRRRFESQLPDTLNLIATSLRAGYSMLQALEAVSQEAPDPTNREFHRVLSEIRLGRSATEALQDSARRMESLDFDWVVLAFTIQREVGGNLAEVLSTTAETMLHRGRMRREMKALTAEGRISGIVLGSMPFLLFIFLSISNPEYLDPMLNTTLGIAALVGAALLLAGGLWWISRIVKIEV